MQVPGVEKPLTWGVLYLEAPFSKKGLQILVSPLSQGCGDVALTPSLWGHGGLLGLQDLVLSSC